MQTFIESFVESADGTRIGILEGGSGPALVVVHGGFTVADEWLDVARLLSANRRVFVVERRGRGRSGDQPAGHSFDGEVNDVAAVMALAGPNADLFGHSFGAALSLGYALKSNFTGNLVLYEPPASFRRPVGGASLPPLIALLESGRGDDALTLAHRTLTQTPDEAIERFRSSPLWQHHLNLLPQLVREVQALDSFAPTAVECNRLACRTTLLLGTESQRVVKDTAAELLERIVGLSVLPIHGQGHVCHLLDPTLMAEIIKKALAG